MARAGTTRTGSRQGSRKGAAAGPVERTLSVGRPLQARLIALEKEIHALNQNPLRAGRSPEQTTARHPHRLAAQAEHLRYRRAIQIRVQQTHAPAELREAKREVDRYGALANAALATHHDDDAVDFGELLGDARANQVHILDELGKIEFRHGRENLGEREHGGRGTGSSSVAHGPPRVVRARDIGP